MRGLIFTDDIQSIEENRVRFNSGLNPERIKNSLLFWDKICHISLPHIPVGPNKDFEQELKTLQQEKVLDNFIMLTQNEINTFQSQGLRVPAYIEQNNLKIIPYDPILVEGEIEGVGLIIKGDIIEAGNGLKIGESKMRVKELYTNALMTQALLTNHLNNENNGFWCIGQSNPNFEMPIISGVSTESPLLELTLNNILPFPLANTPIDEILKFKEKYSGELVTFQLALSKLNKKIEDSGGDFRVVQDVKDEITISLQNLHRTLDESKIRKGLGIVKTLLDIKQIGSAPLIAGAVAHLAEVPILIGALSGYAISGAISLISKKDKKIEHLDKTVKDFAYLYYAEKKFK